MTTGAERKSNSRRFVSLRVLLLVPIILVLVLVASAAYWTVRQDIEHNVMDLSRDELAIFSDSMRLSLVNLMRQGADDPVLQHALQQLRQSNQTIRELRLLHGPAVTRQFGLDSDQVPATAMEKQVLASGEAALNSCPECKVPELQFVYPIRAEKSCLECHQAKVGETIGLLSGSMDMRHIQSHIHRSEQIVLRVAAIAALIIFVGLLYLLHMLLFRRLDRLKDAAGRLAAGEMQVRAEGYWNDEVGQLFDSFNRMAERLQQSMESLDQDLRDRTDQLGHMLNTNHLLTSSRTLDDVLAEFVRAITEAVKVTCGRILLLEEEGARLRLAASWPIRTLAHLPQPQECRDDHCPELFTLLAQKEPRLFHPEDVDSGSVRDLLFFDATQWVLALPILNRGEMIGIVLLNEVRNEKREPADERKLRYAMAMAHELAAVITNARLNDHLTRQMEEAVFAMAEAVDKKSPWTAGHARRVAEHARAIGGKMELPDEELENLYRAGLLHDIGKIGTPGAILNKEGRLTPEEFEQLQRHPADGADILARMRGFAPLIPAVKHHHERFDGNGYPDGLQGEAIPLAARIMAVADAFDAMISDRPYREGMSTEQAWRQLEAGAGRQFDPEVVAAFRKVLQPV